MPRVLFLLAIALTAAACTAAKLDAEGLAERLEAEGLGSKTLDEARCQPGVQGWHFVCTFRVGRKISREKAAFMVDRDRIQASSAVMALDLPVGPAPGDHDRAAWSAFVETANTICAERRRQIGALPRTRGRTEFVARFGRAARIQRVELLQLEDLTPPPGQEYGIRFRQLLDSEKSLLAASGRLRAALKRRDPDAASKAASDVEVNARKVDKAARSLGLTLCTQTS